MSTTPLETAITSTRSVLLGVSSSQLSDATPCAEWNVGQLINHIVGAQHFFASSVKGEPVEGEAPDFSAGDYLASFDSGAQMCLDAFKEPGAMDKMITLPFGTMPGSAFVGLAATDTFTHGWDLAKATGQNTDLAPELAKELLEGSRANISPAFRNEAGSPFGFEKPAASGSSKADELAAFLGRSI